MDREPSSGPVAARNEDSLAQRARRQPVQRAEAVAQYQPKPGVQQELEERDTLIRELRQRVQRLEEKIEPEADRDRPPTSEAEVPPPSEETGPSKSEEDKPGKSAAPGQFEVDEEAAERALERTLIQEGALLFPFGQGEITPSFTYTREELERQLFATSGVVIGTRDVRRNEFTGGLALRIGLPFDSQLELGLPYRFVDQSSVDQFLRSQSEQDRSGSGLGDLSIGLAKTFLREGYWWPDVIGRVTWDSDTGDEVDNGVSLGGGFHEVAGSLVLLKRQDPLAFTGSVLYQAAFEKDSVSPGNEVSFSIGAALAASPDTSLRFSISQRFSEELEINDQVIEGSDQAVGLLTIGASSIITRGLFLNLSSGIGLSDDAPEYSVTLSLGKRFTVPTRF